MVMMTEWHEHLVNMLVVFGALILMGSLFVTTKLYFSQQDHIAELTEERDTYIRLSDAYKGYSTTLEDGVAAFEKSYNDEKAKYIECLGTLENSEPIRSVSYIGYSPPELLTVSKQIADSHGYDMYEYNCQWFTQRAVQKHRAMGYDAYEVMVKTDCGSGIFDEKSCNYYNGRHMIERIDNLYIETVTGEIIPPSRYISYGIQAN